MRKIDRLMYKARSVTGCDKYSIVGWVIPDREGLWNGRLDIWSGIPHSAEHIISSGHKTEEECIEAVEAMIDQYPPQNPLKEVAIIIGDGDAIQPSEYVRTEWN